MAIWQDLAGDCGPCGQGGFYGWEDPKLIGLLAISCVGNSIATGRIIQHKVAGDDFIGKTLDTAGGHHEPSTAWYLQVSALSHRVWFRSSRRAGPR
jgi:hypothetical protein